MVHQMKEHVTISNLAKSENVWVKSHQTKKFFPLPYKLCNLSNFWKPFIVANPLINSKVSKIANFQVLYQMVNLILVNGLILRTRCQSNYLFPREQSF